MTVTMSEPDRPRLQRERFDDPHPRVPRTMEAVYLTALDQSRSPVAQNVGVTEGAVLSPRLSSRGRGRLGPLQPPSPVGRAQRPYDDLAGRV